MFNVFKKKHSSSHTYYTCKYSMIQPDIILKRALFRIIF